MALSQWLVWLLAAVTLGVGLTTYPYLATAIAYRQRDNGLAYILLLMGVGVWNGMVAAQLLSADPLVDTFFLALSMVGALLAGLGWFLFASTASSTPELPHRRLVYGAVAWLVGIDIALTITTPIHSLYWSLPAESATPSTFAEIVPTVGYWFHTQLLVTLFGAGALLFAAAWADGIDVHYTRSYVVASGATAVALLGSNVVFPGGASVASIVAGLLTTVGWHQARRKLASDRGAWSRWSRRFNGWISRFNG